MCHQFDNTIKNMKYKYVLSYTNGKKVLYPEFLFEKLRMEKRLKEISEQNSLTFPRCVKFFKNVPWLFQVFKDFLKKPVFFQVF